VGGADAKVQRMESRDQWSRRHSTLMRQRALVLTILQRGVLDTPPALPPRPTSRRRFGYAARDARQTVSS
jgi:hypothetical protein